MHSSALNLELPICMWTSEVQSPNNVAKTPHITKCISVYPQLCIKYNKVSIFLENKFVIITSVLIMNLEDP